MMILWPLCLNLTMGFSADQVCLLKSIISSLFHWGLIFLLIHFTPRLNSLFLIPNTKNFCLGMFFGESEGQGHNTISWFLRWIRFFPSLSSSRIPDGHRHFPHHQGQGHVHTWRLRGDLGKILPSPKLRSKSALLTGITIESWQKWKVV